ncbi:Hypothetical Protein RSKD131_3545 [Cereibacter sphaeroides KD131]|nr:Hypothetical Protein RSKD131_3545 [Cereibacter sphaeroides KD131]
MFFSSAIRHAVPNGDPVRRFLMTQGHRTFGQAREERGRRSWRWRGSPQRDGPRAASSQANSA